MPPLAGRSTSNNGRCVSQDLFSTCSTTVSLVPAISYQSLSSQTLESQDNGLCPALRCPPQGHRMGGHNKHLRRQWRDRGREPRPVGQPFSALLSRAQPQSVSGLEECLQLLLIRLPLVSSLCARITGFEWSDESGKHCATTMPQIKPILPHNNSPAANEGTFHQQLF